MAALTQADVDRLKARLDAGDRAGFYLLYHDLTGSNEALAQAEVSSFSGELGRQAMHMNAAVQAYLWGAGRADQYPGPVENFSQTIAENLYNHIAKDVENGGTGIFRDRRIFNFAKEIWENNGIGDCFPGNLVDPEVPSAPRCSRVAAILGGVRTAAEWLDAIGPMPPAIPPGGRQLTTATGQATYVVDNSVRVFPGSVQRTPTVPRPFDFDVPWPDGRGQIDSPDPAGQTASASPNYGVPTADPWSGIIGATSPTIPVLVPGNLFSWSRPDLTSTARAPEGVFKPAVPDIGAEFAALAAAPPQTKVSPQPFPATPSSPFSAPVPPALLPLVPHFVPQWLDANKAPASPSGGTADDADTQPNFAGSAGAGLGLASAQPMPQPFPATPSSPYSVPVPPALLPLVKHFFPQWLDSNGAPAWPSGGTPDDADTQPNFAGSAGGSLGLTAAQPTPQPLPAAPTSPFSVPVPPALLPLARHFFPQWLDTNKAPAWPSAETSDDGGT